MKCCSGVKYGNQAKNMEKVSKKREHNCWLRGLWCEIFGLMYKKVKVVTKRMK